MPIQCSNGKIFMSSGVTERGAAERVAQSISLSCVNYLGCNHGNHGLRTFSGHSFPEHMYEILRARQPNFDLR